MLAQVIRPRPLTTAGSQIAGSPDRGAEFGKDWFAFLGRREPERFFCLIVCTSGAILMVLLCPARGVKDSECLPVDLLGRWVGTLLYFGINRSTISFVIFRFTSTT